MMQIDRDTCGKADRRRINHLASGTAPQPARVCQTAATMVGTRTGVDKDPSSDDDLSQRQSN